MNQVNVADQTRELATLFRSFASAVFGYRRLHFGELSETQRDELEDRGEALLGSNESAKAIRGVDDPWPQGTPCTADQLPRAGAVPA